MTGTASLNEKIWIFFIHLFIHSFIHSFIHLFIFSFIHRAGILKNVSAEEQQAVEGEVDEEGNPIEVEDNAGDTSGNHKLTQLNGPVIDPTFSGRDNQQQTARIPFAKGKKKPVCFDSQCCIE